MHVFLMYTYGHAVVINGVTYVLGLSYTLSLQVLGKLLHEAFPVKLISDLKYPCAESS